MPGWLCKSMEILSSSSDADAAVWAGVAAGAHPAAASDSDAATPLRT